MGKNSDYSRSNLGYDIPTFNLLYISSTIYSGSTLLSFVLGAHPEIATVGEPPLGIHIKKFVTDEYQCSCGNFIRECLFWRRVTEDMRRKGFDFDVANFDLDFEMARSNQTLNRLLAGSLGSNFIEQTRDYVLSSVIPSFGNKLKAQCEKNRAFVESVLKVTGRKCFVDASKEPLRIRYLAKVPSINLKVIHLIRDGRAFVNSFLNKEATSHGGRDKMSREAVVKGAEYASVYWMKTYATTTRLAGLLPQDNYFRLIYENLCADTDAVLMKLFKFAGVDPEFKLSQYRSNDHHIIGNVMRLDSGNSEIKLDTKWRTQLGETERGVFESIAGRLNRELGYE
ncbi:MAG: sulfotransferase [Deltaproteobacteria bacterium]